MNQKSFELWKKRIADRKDSGLKVTDWCEKNGLSKDSYYYWLKRIEVATQKADAPMPVFIEVEPTYITPRQTVISDLQIKWIDINLTINNSDSAKLAAEFISQLQKLC